MTRYSTESCAPREGTVVSRLGIILVAAIFLGAVAALIGCAQADEGGRSGEQAGMSSEGGSADSAGGESDGAANPERSGGGNPGGGPGGGARAGGETPTRSASTATRYRTARVAGRVEPASRLEHQVPVSGLVQRLQVATGERVEIGDLLFEIERDDVGGSFRPAQVRSRIAGTVSEVSVEESQHVSSGSAGVTVVSQGDFRLRATISDKDAFFLSTGERVQGRTPNGASVEGFLSARSEEPNYETGLFQLTFRFPRTDALRVGTFVVIELPTEQLSGIFVDREAIDRRSGRYYLWVVDEDEQIITRREVEPGATLGSERLISDGLSEGERYIERLTGQEREGARAPEISDAGGGR